MKFSASALTLISAALLASTTPSSATPLAFNADNDQISVPIQVPFSSTPRVLTFPNWFSSAKDDGDICPRLPVQCVKDGKVVGDIGEQDFCRQGLSCQICNPKKKTLDCNTKFVTDCKAQCVARGPLGGKAEQVSHKANEMYDYASHKASEAYDSAENRWEDFKGYIGGAFAADEDDICPDMKVSCKNKDGKTVGDIGKKPFCRDGVTCGQCHQTENSVECNAKFLKDCAAQCEATGPLGGKGVFVHIF